MTAIEPGTLHLQPQPAGPRHLLSPVGNGESSDSQHRTPLLPLQQHLQDAGCPPNPGVGCFPGRAGKCLCLCSKAYPQPYLPPTWGRAPFNYRANQQFIEFGFLILEQTGISPALSPPGATPTAGPERPRPAMSAAFHGDPHHPAGSGHRGGDSPCAWGTSPRSSPHVANNLQDRGDSQRGWRVAGGLTGGPDRVGCDGKRSAR